MFKTISIIIAFFLYAFIPNSLSANDEKLIKKLQEEVPRLEIEYVIKIAKEYSKERSDKVENFLKVEDYFITSVEYDSLTKEWTISFPRKRHPQNDGFRIVINDVTEEIRMYPMLE